MSDDRIIAGIENLMGIIYKEREANQNYQKLLHRLMELLQQAIPYLENSMSGDDATKWNSDVTDILILISHIDEVT